MSQVPIRELLRDSQNGLSKRKGDTGEPVPVLRLANVIDGAIDESDVREIRLTDKEIVKYALQPGDLLCIRVNGSRNLVGRVVPFTAQRRWAYCDHFIRLRPDQTSVDSRYLAHYLNTRVARRQIELNMVSSAGQNTVSQGTMLDLSVPLPDLATQRVVVAELEKQFSRLDEAVANLQRVKANLYRYAASVLDATTAGGLVEESVERARSWQQTTLGAVADVIDPNPSHRMPAYVVEGYPLISSENFVGSEGIDFTKGKKVAEETLRKQRELFRIESGDFALSRIGTIGKTRFLPIDRAYCLSHALVVIKVKVQEVDKRWLRYAVSSSRVLPQARSGVQSVGVPDLGMGKIRAFEISLPPLEVQKLIAIEVDRRLSIVREVESEVDANLKRAQALRQAVLARAFGSPPDPCTPMVAV